MGTGTEREATGGRADSVTKASDRMNSWMESISACASNGLQIFHSRERRRCDVDIIRVELESWKMLNKHGPFYFHAMTRRRAIKITCGAVVGILAVGALLNITVARCSPKTCTLCRAERMDWKLLGYSWQTYRDTEFTEWYRTHRPEHQHKWERLTCTQGFSVFGTTTFFGCGSRHPICEIPPDRLRQFAEHADTSTLTAFFDGITSANRDTQLQAVELAWENIMESR